MEIEIRGEGQDLERAWSAAEVVGFIVKSGEQVGLKVPPGWRGVIGRHAKTLIADGFPADVVLAASWMGVLRGKPEHVQCIAGDLMLARSGMAMTTKEYTTKLARFGAAQNETSMLVEHKERVARREQEIEERRNGNG